MFSRKQKQIQKPTPKPTKCELLKQKLQPVNGLEDFDRFDFAKQAVTIRQPNPFTLFNASFAPIRLVTECPTEKEKEEETQSKKFEFETEQTTRMAVAINCVEGTFTFGQNKQQVKLHLKQPKFSVCMKSIIQEKSIKSLNTNCVVNVYPNIFVGLNCVFPSCKLIDVTVDDSQSISLNEESKHCVMKDLLKGLINVRHNASAFISYEPRRDTKVAIYCDLPTNAYGMRAMYNFKGMTFYGNALIRNKTFDGQFAAIKKTEKTEKKIVITSEKKLITELKHSLTNNLKAIAQIQWGCFGVPTKIAFGFDCFI